MGRTSAVLLASLTLLFIAIIVPSAATRCKAGEVYNGCGSACPPSCSNRSPICATACKSGCFCKNGTIRNDKGECVKVEKCCSGNTEYQECGNDCPNTCAAFRSPEPVVCTFQCSTGCFCKRGYKQLPNSKKCVLPKYCPKGSYTYFSDVGPFQRLSGSSITRSRVPCILQKNSGTSSLNMGRTSAALLASLTLLFIAIIVPSAATRCKAGEVYNGCGSPCPPSCSNRSPICADMCKSGCFCKNGTMRNDKGECVKVEKCCSGNTIFKECGNNCPNTCADYNSPGPVMCPKYCTSGCFCKPGYKQLPNSKKCVLPKYCPKNGNTY
ncbi:zonadhesin-like [Ranitomeya variabilis]|uniref:zonadhesin-like n=1 Tax=Ranitomeya variabilis TaxID=490064 RepID=UPI0040570035